MLKTQKGKIELLIVIDDRNGVLYVNCTSNLITSLVETCNLLSLWNMLVPFWNLFGYIS